MPLRTVSVLLAPLGAIVVWITWLTPYRIFEVLANMMVQRPDVGEEPASLTLFAVAGIAGISMLSIGMTIVSWQSLRMDVTTRFRLFLTVCGIACAVIAIFYGNWILRSAFVALASGTVFTPAAFLERFQRAWLPMHLGYAGLVCGAILAFLTSAAGSKSPIAHRALSPWPVRLFCLLALVTTCLSGIWMALHVSRFESLIGSAAPVKPTTLALHVSAVLTAVYLMLLGLAGFGLALFVRAVTRSPREADFLAPTAGTIDS